VNLWDDANHHLSFRTAIDSPGAGCGIYNIIRENMPVCQETCPLHLDIRGYIGLIADGKFAEALALIREKLPFPGVIGRICPHPCEEECNRGTQDEPLSICGLKRFVADFELQELGRPKVPAKSAAREEKVAVVGAGPAGLTCAHDLASLGYRVTIFESLPVPGGMLAVGIPEYRLPKAVLQKEIDVVRALGVEIKLNTTIGKNLTIDDLFRQDFKAVFIGVGAHQSQKLMVPGEDTKGVVQGIDFLRNLNLGREVWVGEKVTIIGGGNVAIDAARSALKLGAKEVSILYRRSRQEMPAYSEEIEAAEAEGVRIHYLVAPAGVLTSSGKVKGLCCTRMELGEPDALGRRQAIIVRGSEFDIESDMIILAIGQVTDFSFLGQNSRIKTVRGSSLVADPETMATTRPGVFAGGDAVTGPGIAVEAIAAGKRAAISIAKYLEKE
jgi:NADPH-dependent glutamate synthase beta subunit-like oxidoreductase